MTTQHLLATALAALALQACCAPPPAGPASGPHGHRPPEPPAEAFKACAGKSEGAAVSIALKDGKTLAATCVKMGNQLAARPNDMPPRGSGDKAGQGQ